MRIFVQINKFERKSTTSVRCEKENSLAKGRSLHVKLDDLDDALKTTMHLHVHVYLLPELARSTCTCASMVVVVVVVTNKAQPF